MPLRSSRRSSARSKSAHLSAQKSANSGRSSNRSIKRARFCSRREEALANFGFRILKNEPPRGLPLTGPRGHVLRIGWGEGRGEGHHVFVDERLRFLSRGENTEQIEISAPDEFIVGAQVRRMDAQRAELRE